MTSSPGCGQVAERRHLPSRFGFAMGSVRRLERAGRIRLATAHLPFVGHQPAAQHPLTDVAVAPAGPALRRAEKAPVEDSHAG